MQQSHPHLSRGIWFLLLLLLLTNSSPSRPGLELCAGDIGPKPRMKFRVTNGDLSNQRQIECARVSHEDRVGAFKPDLASGCYLLDCEQPEDCFNENYSAPFSFLCTSSYECDSWSYGYARYHRLVLRFSDGRLHTTPIFEHCYDDCDPESSAVFHADYEVTVHPSHNRLDIRRVKLEMIPRWNDRMDIDSDETESLRPVRHPPASPSHAPRKDHLNRPSHSDQFASRFRFAAFITWMVELITTGIIVWLHALMNPQRYSKISTCSEMLRLLMSVSLANLISLPTIWYLLPHYFTSILIQEVIVTTFEACVIYVCNSRLITSGGSDPSFVITAKEATILAILINLTSVAVGHGWHIA